MADLLQFNGLTVHGIPVEQVLETAKDAKLANVLVIGTDSDGELYVAADHGRVPEHVYMIEFAKKYLLEL